MWKNYCLLFLSLFLQQQDYEQEFLQRRFSGGSQSYGGDSPRLSPCSSMGKLSKSDEQLSSMEQDSGQCSRNTSCETLGEGNPFAHSLPSIFYCVLLAPLPPKSFSTPWTSFDGADFLDMDLVQSRGSFDCAGVAFTYMHTVQKLIHICYKQVSVSPFQPTVFSLQRVLVMFISHCIKMLHFLYHYVLLSIKKKIDSVEAHWLCANKRLRGFSDAAACFM